MAIVVIGGHSRSVGKTSVVAGLIAALPEYHWTALKITQYGHGVCSLNGESCHCATDDHTWAITDEKDRSGDSDTSRFLVAGAVRALWVRTERGRLAEAVPTIRRRLAESENVILESNSILKFVRPELYLTVLDPATADFKRSAQEFLDQADAVILHAPKETDVGKATWTGVSLKPVAKRPIFQIHPPDYVTAEIVDFVKSKLSSAVKPKA
ncbi:MAG TPA: hypothetical protein VN950_25445 [Terriglobales bacterium]|nr:hypothetical protein [Terriglobales bacterium]